MAGVIQLANDWLNGLWLLRGFISALVLAWIAYWFALNQARHNSLRDARLKAYAELTNFTSHFPITQHTTKSIFTDKLLQCMAPARLLASPKTESLMRDYYDEVEHIFDLIVSDQTTPNVSRLNQLTLDLEESMRVDLGVRKWARKLRTRETNPIVSTERD